MEYRTRNAAVTSVATSTTSAVLAEATTHSPLTIFNDSSAVLYVRCGAGDASSTTYTTQVAAGALLELPFNYTGRVTGVLASGTGSAKVTAFA